MSTCKCGHPDLDHVAGGLGHCLLTLHPACGCDSFRPRPSAGDEAESWLAGREPVTGKSATTEEGAA